MPNYKVEQKAVSEVDTGDVVYIGEDGRPQDSDSADLNNDELWANVLATKSTITRGYSFCVQPFGAAEHEATWQNVSDAPDATVLVRTEK
jgi:hypothetical protein